jgi:hypothetical protein
MADRTDRVAAFFDNAYPPPNPNITAEHRQVNALEYSAHQLFKIRKLLEEMNERGKQSG